jgi:hypothetical protein
MNLANQLQTRYDWTPNFRQVFRKLVPSDLKTFRVPQTTGTQGWIIFTYENNIPVCLWLNSQECYKIPCCVDERICNDTFLRVEKVNDLEFIISDIWLYNSNCVYASTTFSQRYKWLKELISKFMYSYEGFAKFIHKSEIEKFKVKGFEEHPENIPGRHGYFTDLCYSQQKLKFKKTNIPDCYELITGNGYLKVPDIRTSEYLRNLGEEFVCECKPDDETGWWTVVF